MHFGIENPYFEIRKKTVGSVIETIELKVGQILEVKYQTAETREDRNEVNPYTRKLSKEFRGYYLGITYFVTNPEFNGTLRDYWGRNLNPDTEFECYKCQRLNKYRIDNKHDIYFLPFKDAEDYMSKILVRTYWHGFKSDSGITLDSCYLTVGSINMIGQNWMDFTTNPAGRAYSNGYSEGFA